MNFLDFYQNLPSKLSPYLFSIAGFKVHIYGLMYIIAYFFTVGLVKYRLKRMDAPPFNPEMAEKITLNSFLGAVVGARFGYVLFYNLRYYLAHPLEIILPFSFKGGFHITGIAGMSYHGGVIGLLITVIYLARKNNIKFIDITDLFSQAIPLGYTFGRLGNFFNKELYGRVTDSPIGMYFSTAPTHELRHPSQLYEAFFEGIILFLILWTMGSKNLKKGTLTASYLIGYGTFRFFIEFFRQPDSQMGFVFLNFFSMGQVLCFGMIILGVFIMRFYRKSKS